MDRRQQNRYDKLSPWQKKIHDGISFYLNLQEKVMCYGITFLITPLYFGLYMNYYQNGLIQIYQLSHCFRYIYTILPFFGFINVMGNMLMIITTDTSIKRCASNDLVTTYCEACKAHVPSKSYHCYTCKCCILRRDYHCMVFSRCVGQYNKRYYVMLATHLIIAMIYCSYNGLLYLLYEFDSQGVTFCFIEIFTSILRLYFRTFIISFSYNEFLRDIYLGYLLLNVVIFGWAMWVLVFQVKTIIRGLTAKDTKDGQPGDVFWRGNVKDTVMGFRDSMRKALGVRWYLALLCPFIRSDLPEEVDDKLH